MKNSTLLHSLGIVIALFALAGCNKSTPTAGSAAMAPASTTTAAVPSTTSAAMNAFVARTNTSARMQPAVLNKLAGGVLDSSKPDKLCALDTIDGSTLTSTTNIKLGHTFVFAGWVTASNKQAPTQFTLVLKGSDVYGIDADTGISRPDVAKALSSPMAGTAGFSIESTLSGLPDGTYQVLALVKSPDGGELCDTGRQVVASQ